MKSRVINNCRHLYVMFLEKIMELWEYLKLKLKHKNSNRSDLVEIYSIKEGYINEEYVQNFLKGRIKTVGPDRYRIEVRIDKNCDEEEVIGEVTLMRKNKELEKATLITKRNIPKTEKLIYWRF